MKRPSILIVTCANDSHVDVVIPHLAQRRANWHVLEVERFLDVSLTIHPQNGTGRLSCGESSVKLEDITSVWYRKPDSVDVASFARYMSPDELDFIQAEMQETVYGICARLDDRYWLTPRPSDRLGARKTMQLAVASQVGFRTPKTIITTDEREAAVFAESVNHDVAIKALSWASAIRESSDSVLQYGVYTRRLSREELPLALNHIRHAPSMLQEYIEKEADLRIVAIGRDHIFAVRIDSQNGSFASEDCRFGIRDLPHHLVSCPDLLAPIRRYMDALNLEFACFDFALERGSGQPVFLEANTNGQWAWLESETGAPIAAAVAAQLVSGSSNGHITRGVAL